jgi:hypothetical protein
LVIKDKCVKKFASLYKNYPHINDYFQLKVTLKITIYQNKENKMRDKIICVYIEVYVLGKSVRTQLHQRWFNYEYGEYNWQYIKKLWNTFEQKSSVFIYAHITYTLLFRPRVRPGIAYTHCFTQKIKNLWEWGNPFERYKTVFIPILFSYTQ